MVLTAIAPMHTVSLPWLTRAGEFVAATLIWEVAMVAARLALGRANMGARLTTATGLILTVLVASVPATTALALILIAAGERMGAPASLYAKSLLLGLLVGFARRGLRFKSNSSVHHARFEKAIYPNLIRCVGSGSQEIQEDPR